MTLKTHSTKYATATFNPHGQNLDQIQAVIASIAGRGGCPRCGLIAILSVEFQGDPPEVLGKQNVVSYIEQGLNVN